MNSNQIVYRTIVMKGTSEGLDKVAADLNKVAAAHKGVTVASEQTEKTTLSLEQAMKRQSLRLDEVARAQNNIARERQIADKGLKEGLIDQTRHNELMSLATQRYATATTATKGFAQQTGLARHELINLGRQAQDVGVSLASGQSPLMVLAQQGSQIADVFISSGKSVGTFFSQAIGWAGRFITSAAGVVTAIGGIAAGVLYMASTWATAQREIEKALTGPGAASGMTRSGINRIAEQAGGVSGMSVGQAREAATIFAATGKIYEQNITSATLATRELALAMGKDTADAAKTLAEALVDPSKGALDLNKQFGFLDATTLNYIRTLQSHNQLQEAQRVLLDASAASIKKQADQAGFWTRAWNDVTASADLYSETLKKVVLGLAQVVEQATGVNLGGFSDEQQLGRAREKQQGAQQALGRGEELGLGERSMRALGEAARAAEAEVARLEQKMFGLGQAAAEARLDQLSLEADAYTRALLPAIAQVEQLTTAISKLEQARAAGVGGPNIEAALRAATLQLITTQETAAAEERRVAATLQLALLYPSMSIEVAKQLNALQGQLQIAEARTGREQMIAQEIVTQNNLLLQGKTLEEAVAIAAAQRAVAEANVAKSIGDQIHALEDQIKLSNTRSQSAENAVKAEIAYNNAVRDGADAADARALKDATLRAAQAQDRKQASQQQAAITDEAEGYGRAIQQSTGNLQSHRIALEGVAYEWSQISEYMQSYKFSLSGTVGPADTTSYTTRTGPEVEREFLTSWRTLDAEQRAKPYTGGLKNVPGELTEEINKKLDETFKNNTEATKENTAATQTMTDVLSPFYSSDPRRTHLGFRSFAGGGIMTPYGELPLKQYQSGGVASSPQVAVYGEGATPEAYVPVPSGRIPVEIKQPANNNQRPVNVTINVMGNADGNTVSALKSTAFQQAQAMRRAMG